jgi:hypothetical protein
MVTNKPTILIYAIEPEQDLLREICAGIEEEGVLFELVEKEAMDFDDLCFDSANDSILGSGIGILHSQAALHLRLLPKGKQLFSMINPTLPQARSLGANAARAVKRIPFKEL